MTLLIKGGRIVDPVQDMDGVGDILVADGVIAKIGSNLTESADEVVHAEGLIVVPGLVDLRTRLGAMDGGGATEAPAVVGQAAVRGGFTTVLVHPDRGSLFDREGAMRAFAARAAAAPVRMLAAGALTARGEGVHLTEAYGLKQAGAAALTDGRAPADSSVFRRALRYAAMVGLPVLVGGGDPSLEADGVVNEGDVSTRLGLPGLPAVAEVLDTARAIALAIDTGCPVHVGPVSTADAVRLIRRAKAEGAPITAETTFHHLVLTEKAVLGFAPYTKVYPPLRTERDRQALIAAVADGTVDCIVTDHTPLPPEEAEVEWANAPFGIVGFETAVALSVTHLLAPGFIGWSQWIERVSLTPAKILRLDAGTLIPGRPADITIIDPNAVWTVQPESTVSRARNSPFFGQRLKGRVVETVLNGRRMSRAMATGTPSSANR